MSKDIQRIGCVNMRYLSLYNINRYLMVRPKEGQLSYPLASVSYILYTKIFGW